jgi:hypothetical protein
MTGELDEPNRKTGSYRIETMEGVAQTFTSQKVCGLSPEEPQSSQKARTLRYACREGHLQGFRRRARHERLHRTGEHAMAMLRSNMTRKPGCAGSLIGRYFVAGLFVCVAAISALAQTGNTTEKVVVTLLLTDAQTTDAAAQQMKYLSVAASGGAGFQEAKSWLYFNAGALPDDIKERDFTSVRLQLAPKEGAARGMVITVTPSRAKGPRDRAQPQSYSPSGAENSTLVSPPLPTDPRQLELRSDSVSLTLGNLLQSESKSRYIGLLLLPQPNASRRVYYGLNTKSSTDNENHPDRLPRLIITYSRRAPPITACTSEPSALALIQSDGRLADRSSCNFSSTDNPTSNYVLYQVVADTLTKAPVVYGGRLYVVRKVGSETRLLEMSSLGSLIASVPLNGEVRPGSPMVVDRFGRLRIITNDAIFTAELRSGPNLPGGRALPATVDKTPFPFDQAPETVVPGPDGTLYIVKQGIFALNPEVGELDTKGRAVAHPEKLWQVATNNENAKITLSPDGRFLYALSQFSENKSRFIAINAQTGKDVQLPEKAGFPDNLNSFRNPVVVRGLKGVDFVYITGNSGSGATLWGVQNDPVTQEGDSLARLTEVWKYPLATGSAVGQPILDPTAPPEGVGASQKKLYFLQGFLPDTAGKPKLIAVTALDGTKVAETPEPVGVPEKTSTEGSPVVDSAGNVFWANHALYGFTSDTKSLLAAPVLSSTPQLLFGPVGTLYAVYSSDQSTTVSALIPSFQQSDTSPTSIYSPTNLYVTGSAARQGGKPWTLEARGSVILGANFSVKTGETLTVRVNVSR